MKFKLEVEISISNLPKKLCRGVDKARQGLVGLRNISFCTASFSMTALRILPVKDYRLKYWYLRGHRKTGAIGYLKDVLDNLDKSGVDLSQRQFWIKKLDQNTPTAKNYLNLCELYFDPTGDLTLENAARRSPDTSEQSLSGWVNQEKGGPREDFGLATAALYGFGCPDDDPSRPITERRGLWRACKDPHWRVWCDGSAEEFADAYGKALVNDTLWFPERLLRAIADHSTDKDVAEVPTVATTNSYGLPPVSEQLTPKSTMSALYIGLVIAGALVLSGLTMALWPVTPSTFAGASTWAECLPNGGKINMETTERSTTAICPDSGFLPLDPEISAQVKEIRQGSLPVTFQPEKLGSGLWQKELWRPSPSFSRTLTQRRVATLELRCLSSEVEIQLANPDWGTRKLDCSSPHAQITLLRPQEAYASLTIKTQNNAAPQRCQIHLPVSAKDHFTLDPAKDCGGLPTPVHRKFPLRPLINGVDLIQDAQSGLLWLADPFAAGSTQMWEPAGKWDAAEILQRIQETSGTNGWRLANAQEVLTADPNIFARVATADNVIVAIAQDSGCPSGLGRVAFSTVSSRSHAEVNAAIALPCLIKAPEVGFWIAKDPEA